MTDLPSVDWYAVRCVFAVLEAREDGVTTYEERVTLWHAHSHDEAIERAEADAEAYAADIAPATYLGLAQSYQLFEAPGDGVEVFSLMRDSTLAADDYLNTFFDTGSERGQEAP